MHLSVWERPGELIGRDISQIIEDPPHKRKKTTPDDNSSSCHSSGLHGDDEEDEHNSKRNRTEESMSLVPRPGDVSAFSTWEKELHKMVFDPRYLLLTSDQRKQFVKSRVKDEYKEKKSKLHKAREEFKQLLDEAKITSRSTFKEFCVRYRGDRRFSALTRKKEQEVLFNHCIADPSVLSHHTQHVEDWISLTDPGLVSDSAGSVGETGPEPDVSRDFRIIGFSLKSEWF
eukprot:superscaffoldBa00007554_g22644